jgi:heme A synthase
VAGLHAAAGLAAMGVAGFLAVAAGLAAWLDRWHEPAGRLAWVVVAFFGAQAIVGLAVMLLGDDPDEGLHLLYAVALVMVVPFGLSLVTDAPPRIRSGVLAAAGVVALLLAWRLMVTG